MTKVVVKNGKLDDAIRNLKQKVVRNELLKEVREKEHYSKPGVRRRKAKAEAIKNSRKRDKKERRAV